MAFNLSLGTQFSNGKSNKAYEMFKSLESHWNKSDNEMAKDVRDFI